MTKLYSSPFRWLSSSQIVAIWCVAILHGTVGEACAQSSVAPSFDELEQVLEFLAQAHVNVPSVDILEYYHRYPLVLQKASVRELQTIPAISLRTALAIYRFVRKYPKADFAMLQDSLALSPVQIVLLRFCTQLSATIQEGTLDTVIVSGSSVKHSTVTQLYSKALHGRSPDPAFPRGSLWYRARTRLWAVPQRGFTPQATPSQRFQGSPLDIYQRLTAVLHVDSSWCVELNTTAAKDAGELSIADFLSAYVRAEHTTPDRRIHILLGDFTVEHGQGIAFWSLYGPGKSAEVITPATQVNLQVVPYRSSAEQQFYRGVAVQSDMRCGEQSVLRAIAWSSWQQRAARLDSVQNVITSLDFSGLFRTRSELALRNNLAEEIYGISAEFQAYDKENAKRMRSSGMEWIWSFGVGAQYLYYDKQIVSRSVMVFPYRSGAIASVFGTLMHGATVLTGEIARDASGNIGGRLGLETQYENWRCAASLRGFPSEFRSPFGVNFGEQSKPTNEVGLYLGTVWKHSPVLRLNAYCDIYSTLASTATVAAPVRGIDVLAEAVWRMHSDIDCTLRVRHETKTDQLTLGLGRSRQRVVYERARTGGRIHIQWSIDDYLHVHTRIETAFVGYEDYRMPEIGILGLIGGTWHIQPWMRCTGRVVVFRTDSYDSALWQYEATVPGTLSNPALFGEGVRAYLMVDISPLQAMTFTLRGSLLYRSDVSVLGSGATQISGNTDAQAVIQIDIRL
ncbi:MAG: hypothetical protein RML40_08280 [Bacteroidota bacterium]|nr:hypothetical protein [Candidatus Kapabacteria bacterium]MDW8220512.1 hypothetical protein [Bacteroidota bacterium]